MPALRELERVAGEAFRELGMAFVADEDPPAVEELTACVQAGRTWVVPDDADQPVAYLLLEVVDGAAHVEQVSVHPRHARRGLGGALIDAAAGWAVQHGLPALTLTTYADVPWNAPYYERLGFHVVPAGQLGPGLRRIRAAEAARGLDRWPRVSMRRSVSAP